MQNRSFWSGFATGAGVVAGSWVALQFARRGGMSPIVRLEKSVQIGRPLEDVFDAWANLRRIPEHVKMVKEVRSFGSRTHWRVNVGSTPFEWDAEITQVIPYQAIGWKSVTGPKHSGRITFSRIENDTLVHVHMNYAPAGRVLRPVFASFAGEMEGFIEQALREFKSSMEEGGPSVRRDRNEAKPTSGGNLSDDRAAATGTYGPGPELVAGGDNPRFGAPGTPVEYTRPLEAKS
jgi:uncharacterized membrane protein